MRINVVTIFTEFFAAPLAISIPARAAAAGQVEYRVVDLRDLPGVGRRRAVLRGRP